MREREKEKTIIKKRQKIGKGAFADAQRAEEVSSKQSKNARGGKELLDSLWVCFLCWLSVGRDNNFYVRLQNFFGF